jgi:D-Tyr-tRNAtyr deacylase
MPSNRTINIELTADEIDEAVGPGLVLMIAMSTNDDEVRMITDVVNKVLGARRQLDHDENQLTLDATGTLKYPLTS